MGFIDENKYPMQCTIITSTKVQLPLLLHLFATQTTVMKFAYLGQLELSEDLTIALLLSFFPVWES